MVSPLRGDEYLISLCEMENQTTALTGVKKQANRASPVENAPLLPTAPPPVGEVYSLLPLTLIPSEKHHGD